MARCQVALFSTLSFLSLLVYLIFIHAVAGQPEHVFSLCPDMGTVAPNSSFQNNVNNLLSFLLSNTTNEKHFYDTTVGSGDNIVYGALFCRIDQTISFCQTCISLAIDKLNLDCLGEKSSIVWNDQCLVRYSNESFLGIMDPYPMIPLQNRKNAIDIHKITSNQTGFMEIWQETLENVSSQAATGPPGRKFATIEGKILANLTAKNTLYTLAECSPDISENDCKSCLQLTIGNMTEQCNKKAGCTMMCPNCNMRYDVDPFYGDALVSSPIATFEEKRKQVSLAIGITLSIALAMMILYGAWMFVCKKASKKVNDDDPEPDDIETLQSLKFDVNTIRKAANNFSADKKLGEGGFGEVYKGRLESGQDIAIKRLSSNSKQGIHEFMTEVVIVAKLQHRNLVKLLGYCLSRKEKILVYEFLPNMSLDRYLTDPMKRITLDWSTRFKIIEGIARGLLYLHEDSRLKIVHRDLKPSNILLDEAMNPKIADFGIAKLFGVDQTQDNTNRIVGTFGYMAPEYVIAGHFSVKSDICSFGIIVLELVSGLLRNKHFRQQEIDDSLLHQAWRFWYQGTPLRMADSTFGNNYVIEEIKKCIHIGLLCVQEDAAKRPRMASVVAALNGESITLPPPTSPLFLSNYAYNEINMNSSDEYASASIVIEDITEVCPR